jgi:hypothetical protein
MMLLSSLSFFVIVTLTCVDKKSREAVAELNHSHAATSLRLRRLDQRRVRFIDPEFRSV